MTIVENRMLLLRSRPLAIAAANLFFAGTIAIPALHLAFHELPHDHDGDEIHYHLGDHDHDDDHDQADDHHHHGEPLDPGHGDGSTAHFSIAVSDQAAAPIVFASTPFLPGSDVTPIAQRDDGSAHVSVQRFRGPPAVS